jgi:ferric-dicitrate binding protein FerR (iron transport regulator)
MSTTFDARDGDGVVNPSQNVALADEESLRRTFLSEYSALTAEARADLGAEAVVLAPKVVEGAFVRAWDARARFRTPEEVHHFLVEDVHHAAARALSRRVAARRLAGHEHVDAHATHDPTPEEAWAHIQHALHGEEHSPQALAAAASAARHGAAEHINVATHEGNPWIPVLLGGVVLAGLLGLAAWMTHLSADARFAKALNAPDVRVVSSTAGRLGIVTLDDGTKVRFAPESKITIPKDFGVEMRAVRLEGSAVFDVKPGLEKEFHVFAKDVGMMAKGTSFTVNAYPSDSTVVVVVNEGTVAVGRGKETADVTAGNAMVVPPHSAGRPATQAEREAADGWVNGTFAINDKPLREVLDQFSRWYGLHLAVSPDSVLSRRVTLRASLDSTRQALRGVEQSTGLEFGYVGQNMVFHLPDAKAAKASTAPAKGKKR